MAAKQTYSAFPADYRSREVAMVARWIQAGESGSIIGLGGAGKSNFLGFLCHRPEVIQAYLPDHMRQTVLVLVDLNNMPGGSLDTFFRVMLRALYEARAQFTPLEPGLAEAIDRLYRKVEEKTDPFLSQSALREILFLFQEKAIRLVLVLDSFDRFCQVATPQMLENLRGLRDSFKGTLSYLAGLRRELPHLVKSIETFELYEILDTHYCWLGAMEAQDARWVISQREEATGQAFSESDCQQLIDLTGGYPALLRAASLWLAARRQAETAPDAAEWKSKLMIELSIKNRLSDLRQSLSGVEEATLFVLQKALAIKSVKERQESIRQIENKYQDTLRRLEDKRLCIKTKKGWQLFSPLLTDYIAQMESVSLGRIQRDSKTRRFYQEEQELIDLTRKDRQLLDYFLENPHRICSMDELIDNAWVEDEDIDGSWVSPETVQQAIRHLRKQIELNPARPRYLITIRGEGYYFDPDGAPRG